MTQYAVRDIQPNPFRHMDRYPIRRDKVEALKESLRSTGFWDNVVGRPVEGGVEIAYGHHRLVALQEEYSSNHRVNVIVRDLDDAAMLQIMARENMEEWGTSFSVEMETVAAVVQAFGEGKIDLADPGNSSYQRTAGGASGREYNIRTVAGFLGWTEPSGEPQHKVGDALSALDFIADGLLTEKDFEGLSTQQARAVLEQARQRKDVQEAAARLAEEAATRLRRQAEQVERQHQQAVEDQRKREAQVARARDEEQRRRAQEQAQAAAARQRQLEAERQQAERAYERQQAEASRRRMLAREESSRVGKHVSREIRTGARGYRQAREIADEVIPMKERPPRDINDHARATAKQVSNLLAGDILETKVKELVKWSDSLEEPIKYELSQQLIRLSERARTLAHKFNAEPDERLLALTGDK